MKLSNVLSMGLVAVSSNACVWGPFYDDTVETTTTPVTFSPLATEPGATIRAYCANHYSPWTLIGERTAETTPIVVGGDNLYPAEMTRTIPDACWDSGPTTYLSFTQTVGSETYTMLVFTQAGAQCVMDHVAAGDGAREAGYACRRKVSQIRLNARRFGS